MNWTAFITNFAEQWTSFLLYRSIDTALVFAVVGLLWLLIRNRVSSQFGYLLFLVVLLKLVIPVQVSLPGLFNTYAPVNQTGRAVGIEYWLWQFGESGAIQPTGQEAGSSQEQPAAIPQPETTPSPISIPVLLFVIWMVGVVALLFRQMWVEWKTSVMMRFTVPLKPDMIHVGLQHLQAISSIKRKINWVTADWVKTPMAYGLIQPVIAVPKNMDEHFSRKQTEWIMLHELAHIQRWDGIVSFFQNITRIVFFFNPLVWWLNGIIDQQREYACDDAALAWSNIPRKECGEGFLGVAMQANNLPTFAPATLGMVNYKTFIRRRLMRILDHTRSFQYQNSLFSLCILFLIALLIIPLSWKTAFAQAGEWVQFEQESETPERSYLNLIAYDSKRNIVLLHGGRTLDGRSGPLLKETWEWDGLKWTLIPDTFPDTNHELDSWKMIYDEKNDQLMIFGSRINGQFQSTTWIWEYDTKKWQLISEVGPKARTQYAMAYDSKRGQVILHGGSDDNNTSLQENDTWMWDGETQVWTEVSKDLPENQKAQSMLNHSMTYDVARDRIVMFGGVGETFTVSGGFNNVILEWDGTKWETIPYELDQGPSPDRSDPGLVYNSLRQTVVMYGGIGSSNNDFKKDMWEWDGSSWTQIEIDNQNNPGTHFINMLFLPNQNALFTFGGINSIPFEIEEDISDETWLFQFNQSSSVPNWMMFR